ncbi:MAG: Ig-like domain repeat protein, partial [Acidobacteriales bacterium]|nr:Ig-like domain repeat protein [Terriglobales bacterium]
MTTRMRKLALCAALLLAALGKPSAASTTFTSTGGTLFIPSGASGSRSEVSSGIAVSGLTGSLSQVTVSLNGWSDPDTLNRELLLASPEGRFFEFLSGTGDSRGVSNVTLTFADNGANGSPPFYYQGAPVNGATYVPNVNAYCSGSFEAWPYPAGTSVADCAVSGAYAQSLGVSSGGNATFASQFPSQTKVNGIWTLYIYSPTTDSPATLNSWSITLTMQQAQQNTSTSVSASTGETFEGNSVTLTATVADATNSGAVVNESTVTFSDNGNVITGCSAQSVVAGSATCKTSFAVEGGHIITAQYNADSNFTASSGSAAVFIDHPTSGASPVFCNTGTITLGNSNIAPEATPYPQHIFVSGVGPISDAALQINRLNGDPFPDHLRFLLVAPNGASFVPLAGAGGVHGSSNATLILTNASSAAVPDNNSDTLPGGTYAPTDLISSLVFPSPAPQTGYNLPPAQGLATFATSFAGLPTADGMWSLYVMNTNGDTGAIGGYCLAFSTGSLPTTQTAINGSPSPGVKGQPESITATVTSAGSPATQGSVTFEESGTVIAGPTSVDNNGQASFQTSSLSEGIHNITAMYSGVTGYYGVSSSSTQVEIDTATTNPAAGKYCNPGGVSIPASGGVNGINGAINSTPYPSRINVTNMAGTVQSVAVTLNNFSHALPDAAILMITDPLGHNLVFWDAAGGNAVVTSQNLMIADAVGPGNPIPAGVTSNGSTYYPTANPQSPESSFGPPAPAANQLSFAPPYGSATFTTSFANENPAGYWSLFLINRASGAPMSVGSWCLNFTGNPPALSLAATHTGNFTQGDSADIYTITVANPNGPGATAGNLQLVDTLPSGMTAVSISETANTNGGNGSDWTCNISSASCTRTTPMPVGESDTITLRVAVGFNTASQVTNSVQVSGGGISATQMANDSTTVNQSPGYLLATSVSPSGGGTVTANPGNSPGLSAGYYSPGAVVTLTAVPATGYSFIGWSSNSDLAGTGTNPITITMNSNVESVTASFSSATVAVTINTSPSGLQVSADNGAALAAPLTGNWVIGSQHTIATATPQGSNGTQYNFTGWSDGGPISHQVTAAAGTTGPGNNVYVGQVAAGTGDGSSCANEKAINYFNTAGNWSASPTGMQIGPDTTVHLCGIITSELYAKGGGSSGHPAIILFEPGAKIQISPGADANGALNLGTIGWIVVDGGIGKPCGWNTATNATEGACNGQIENMLYGSPGAACPGGTCTTQATSTIGNLIQSSGASNIEIRNLEVGPSYIHTATTNDAAGTQGILLSNGSNFNVHDNKLHDGAWHTVLAYTNGGTLSNWKISNNEFYNNGHMMAVGAAGASTLNGLTITGNYCHDMSNWDTASDYWHNNCLHSFGAQGSTLNNFILANNIMAGNMGNDVTAQAFLESQGSTGTNFAIFNNVMTGTPANGRLFLLNVCTSGCYIYNNTFVGNSVTNVACSYFSTSQGPSVSVAAFENNVMSNCFALIDSEKSSFGAIDYNTYGIQGSFVWNGNFLSGFAGWQASSGGETHSTSNPAGISLNANFIPQSGSPVKNAAVNVCVVNPSFCSNYPAIKNDLSGTPRPTSAAWDAGAYQFGSSPQGQPPAGSGGSSFTANFSTSYQLTTAATPPNGGTVTPASGNYYAAGTVVTLTATPAAGYGFTGWTGNVANANSASTTLTLSGGPQSVTANFSPVPSATVVDAVAGSTHLLISVDNGPAQTGPLTEAWAPGSQHTIAAVSPQGANGTQYIFTGWSDGGAISHAVTIPSGKAAYTASFSTSYLLTVTANPPGGGTLSPPSGNYYPANSTVSLNANNVNQNYTFSMWTGPVMNPTSGYTLVTMSGPQSVTANFKPSGPPVLSIAPANANFGSVSVNTSHSMSLTLTNTGTSALNLGNISITGTNSSAFSQTNTCFGAIAPSNSCNMNVT